MPNEHLIEEIKLKLEGLQTQLREDVLHVDEPQAKALFETSAEVLQALYTAFEHYEKKDEPAWESSEVKVETKESISEKANPKGQTGAPKSSKPTHG